VSYSSASSTGQGAKKWENGIVLLREMLHPRLVFDVVSYNVGISACSKGKQWKGAFRLLLPGMRWALVPNVVS